MPSNTQPLPNSIVKCTYQGDDLQFYIVDMPYKAALATQSPPAQPGLPALPRGITPRHWICFSVEGTSAIKLICCGADPNYFMQNHEFFIDELSYNTAYMVNQSGQQTSSVRPFPAIQI